MTGHAADRSYSVPVLMYHSVGPVIEGFPWPWLTAPVEVFEEQISAMAEVGYTAITLDDLLAYVKDARPVPRKSVVLTFDDGYLDNYVYAFPILKKYGFKATIFLPTDFVDPSETVRPTLEDVWAGRVRETDLPKPGFLSWAEMRLMENSGLVRIESHTVTHTWYPVSPRIIDFWSPTSSYPWVAWNAQPGRKYGYFAHGYSDLVEYGEPVYESARALSGPRYFPDPALASHLREAVGAKGGSAFFSRPEWKQELLDTTGLFLESHSDGGRTESPEEFQARVRHELSGSRRILEERLGREINFLCLPGGARTAEIEQMAAQAGYGAITCAGDHGGGTPNAPGADPLWIRRIPCLDTWRFRGRSIARTDGPYLLHRLGLFQGSKVCLWSMRLRKVGWLLRWLAAGGEP